jgi:hypothetical protein
MQVAEVSLRRACIAVQGNSEADGGAAYGAGATTTADYEADGEVGNDNGADDDDDATGDEDGDGEESLGDSSNRLHALDSVGSITHNASYAVGLMTSSSAGTLVQASPHVNNRRYQIELTTVLCRW